MNDAANYKHANIFTMEIFFLNEYPSMNNLTFNNLYFYDNLK